MEALFGILYQNPTRPVEREELVRVADLLQASDAEIDVDGNFALAVARNVIDRSTQATGVARAPDDSAWVALTGEIENRGELLNHVARRGLDPGAGTDAELLLALYRELGAGCVRLANGYFNGVIWNRTTRRLLLLADRCGSVKALYYYAGGSFLAFGSAARAVVAHEKVARELDSESLQDLLAVGHPISPRTMFRNVFVLAAGTSLESSGAEVRIEPYWQRCPYVRTHEDLEEIERRYFDALQRAVARCADTRADTGVMLSGGVDSAALVSLLRRAGAGPIKTFSVHVGDPRLSDRAGAQEVARRYETEHCFLDDLDARCLDLLPEMIWHFEYPVQNVHPTYWLCRRMREECEVVLGGYGNDLIWGCWTPTWRAGKLARALLPPLNEIHYLRIRRKLDRRALRRAYPAAARTDRALRRRIAGFRRRTGNPLADFISLDEAVFGDQLVFREVGKSIVDANGLWPRLPYTDAEVTRLAERVPPQARLRIAGPGQTEFKSFFKNLMRKQGVLPPEIIYRPKTWMYSPTAQWLRGDLHAPLVGTLLGKRAITRGLFDQRHLTHLIEEHRAGRFDHTFVLSTLLAVEIWHQLFVDPHTLAKPDLTLSDCAGAEAAT